MIDIQRLVSTLLPFAKAAEDYEQPKSKRHYRDGEHVALSLTVGDLRTARRTLLELNQSVETQITKRG